MAERNKYLAFRLLGDSGKTQTYSVDSRNPPSYGDRLAIIKWYGGWRQYCLFPESETVWNKGCLQDINDFIGGLMEKRVGQSGQ